MWRELDSRYLSRIEARYRTATRKFLSSSRLGSMETRKRRLEGNGRLTPMSFRRDPGLASGRTRKPEGKTLADGSPGRVHPLPKRSRLHWPVRTLPGARSHTTEESPDVLLRQ